MRGAPGGGAVGSVTPLEERVLEPPMLPVVDDDPWLSEPTVPVVGAGIPALPTPVPKFGVTVVSPGPVPPGMPAPEDGVWAGAPGCPGAVEVDVPGAVPVAPPVPPELPPAWASAAVGAAARNSAVINDVRTGMAISCERIVQINESGRGFVPV